MIRLPVRALAFSLALVSPLAAQRFSWQEISTLGVRVRVHEKLKQVPLKLGSGDKYLRAKYEPNGEGDYIWGAKGRFAWDFQVYEFTDRRKAVTQEKKKEPKTTEEKRAAAKLARELRKWKNTFAEWITTNPANISERKFVVKGKETKAKGKKLGFTWWEVLDKVGMYNNYGEQWQQPWYKFAAVYKSAPDKEIALVMSVPIKRGSRPPAKHKKWAKIMLRSIDFLKQEEIAEATVDEDRDFWAKTAAQKKALDAAKANIVDLGHWDYFTSPNYIVLYSWIQKNRLQGSRRFARQVAELMEGIREKYLEYYPPHDKVEKGYSVLRICARYDDFSKYGSTSGGIVGWFSPATKELVIFDDAQSEWGGRDQTITTAFHEGWHQYADAYFPKATLHRWFDEGTGDFFGCFEKKGKRWSYVPAQGRIQSIRSQLREDSHIPLQQMVSWTRAQFYNVGAPAYAEGYSLVDFLERGQKRGNFGKKWNPLWDQVLPRYAKAMLETKDQKKAVAAAFTGIDWEVFEDTWKTWVEKDIKKKGL